MGNQAAPLITSRSRWLCISTIQRMFSMLKGRELPDEADEESTERVESLFDKEPEPINYTKWSNAVVT